jgi:hypothetical protein
MRLSSDELTLAAAACRALAEQYREEANRLKDPKLRVEAIAKSLQADRLAGRFATERSELP